MKLSDLNKSFIIVFVVLLIDQIVKIWIKTNMTYGQEFDVLGNWFKIHFIENNGMAFGMELAGKFGKIILSVFRIVAVFAIVFYLVRLSKQKAPFGLMLSVSLILAGAIGNILDSAFYGLIFSESNYYEVSAVFPKGGGYANFLHGKVVDMLYFPLCEGYYPEWFPFKGGDKFIFFRPVFNIADSAITIGIGIIIIFQKRFFK